MINEILAEEYVALQHLFAIVMVLWLLPLIAYAIDFWTGIEGAKAQKEKIHSHGLRRTIIKIGEYWRVQVMALLIDLIGILIPGYNLPYTSMLVTVVIIVIEYISVKENFKKKKCSNIVNAMDAAAGVAKEYITKDTFDAFVKSMNKKDE